MRTVITIFILFCSVTSYARDFVQFTGHEPEGADRFARRLTRLHDQGMSSSGLVDSAVTWLTGDGYLDASATYSDSTVEVNPGRRYYLAGVTVDSDSARSVSAHEPFTEDNVASAVERLLGDYYYEDGYYFARATVADIAREGTDISIKVKVNKGPIVTVASNEFSGLKYSSPQTVRRMLPASPGDTITPQLLRESSEAAENISYLTFKPPVTVQPRSGFTTADLGYRFTEKRRFAFEGAGGYIPDDPTGLVWNFRATLRNLLGGGREAEIHSERIERGRQALDIRYRQPVFLFGADQLQLGVSTRDFREEFYEFALDGRFDAGLSTNTSLGLILGWKRVEPAASIGFSRYMAGFGLRRRVMDDRINPTSGYDVDWSITYAYRRYSDDTLATGAGGKGYNETHAVLKSNWYRHVIGPVVGHLSANYIGLETSDSLPPLSELVLVGGPGTIRGYRNDQFAAKRAAFGTIEPRFRFPQGYFFVFYDAAYINRPVLSNGKVDTEELYRYGIGGGLSLVGEGRSVTLSLGWAQDAAIDQPRLSIELSYDI